MDKKRVPNDQDVILGQISVFEHINLDDVSKYPEKKRKLLNTYSKPLFTLNQLNIYKRLKDEYTLSRVLLYCCGTIGIEVNECNSVVTYYVFKNGEKFTRVGRAGVLPMDKIIYYSGFEIKNTDIQLKRLHDVMNFNKDKIKRIIQREGDLNILVEGIDEVLSILPNGWVLNFESITSVDCKAGEIFPFKDVEEQKFNVWENLIHKKDL